MDCWKTFCCLFVLACLSVSSWAQDHRGLLMASEGFLVERRLVDGAVEEFILPVDGEVIYVHGRSSADGKILFAVWDETAERMNLVLTEPDGSGSRVVAEDVVWSAWSPAGDQFLYYDSAGALYLSEGEEVRLVALGVAAASFSTDGSRIAVIRTPELNEGAAGKASGLWLLDLGTGEERQLASKYNEDWSLMGYAPYWTPDGQSLLLVASDGPHPFGWINLSGGEVQPVSWATEIPRPTTLFFFFLSPDGLRAFFGVERLDEPDQVWFLNFAEPFTGRLTDVGPVAEGTPLGFVSPTHLLLETESGPASLDVETMLTTPLRDFSSEDLGEAVVGTSSLYRVRYYSPLANGVWRITSWFSHHRTRADGGPYRYDCTYFGRAGHRGTDMATGLGRTIYAGAAGVLDFVNNSCGYRDRCATSNQRCGGGFGNYVRIRHSNGVRSYYAHMRSTGRRSGQRVNCRSSLGQVGSTGHSTGCHVHFEIRNSRGRSVDPYRGSCNWIASSLWRNPNRPQRCQ